MSLVEKVAVKAKNHGIPVNFLWVMDHFDIGRTQAHRVIRDMIRQQKYTVEICEIAGVVAVKVLAVDTNKGLLKSLGGHHSKIVGMCQDGLTLREMADELDVQFWAVKDYINQHEIPRRDKRRKRKAQRLTAIEECKKNLGLWGLALGVRV